MGGHVTTALVEDLPVPTWRGDDGDRLIALLADELSHHPHDVRARATLDALVASRYGLDAEQFDRVLALCPRVPRAEREGAAAAFRRLGGPRAARRKTRNAERERET
jgi:hypothetical protein